MKYAISIIIPLYNNEEFIEQCLDTLLDQTFKDFEIIVVDDGSSDNSLIIAQEYESKHDFIKVLQQENQYAGVARNLGMKHAQGEYLLFLDSDDFFEPTMLEKTYNKAIQTDSDIVLFSGNKYFNKTGRYRGFSALLRKAFLPAREVFSPRDEDIFIYQITTPCPWTKLFKKSFIDNLNLEFSNTPNVNDFYFTTIALASATRISYLYEVFVYYRTENTSSLQANLGKKNLYIIGVLYKTFDELNVRNLYQDNIPRSFLNLAVANVIASFSKLRTVDDKIKFYNLELKEFIEKFDLFNYDDDYFLPVVEKDSFEYIKGIVKSVSWVENRKKYDLDIKSEIVKKTKIENTPKVSVIIPVYNVEEYIIETLDSITSQSLTDIEIICVDDGSTDQSLDIVMEYAKKESRISIVRQQNYGLSVARNTGVKYAKGEYLYFIDSDDLIENVALERLYDICSLKNLDILYFDSKVFFDNEELSEEYENLNRYYQRNQCYDETMTGVKLLSAFIAKQEYLSSACMQIMKREFFINNDCWFYPGILHEDNLYTYKSILLADRVSHINEPFYLRRVRTDSIMTTSKTFNHAYGYFICYKEMLKAYDNLKDLNDLEMNILNWPLTRVLQSARDIFLEIKPEDRVTADFLEGKDKFLFKSNISDVVMPSEQLLEADEKIKEINKRNKELTKKNKKLTQKLNKMKGHPVIKVGRKVKNIFKK